MSRGKKGGGERVACLGLCMWEGEGGWTRREGGWHKYAVRVGVVAMWGGICGRSLPGHGVVVGVRCPERAVCPHPHPAFAFAHRLCLLVPKQCWESLPRHVPIVPPLFPPHTLAGYVYTLEYATQLHYFNVASNQYHRVLRLIKLHLSRVPRSIGVPLKAALGECSTSLQCVWHRPRIIVVRIHCSLCPSMPEHARCLCLCATLDSKELNYLFKALTGTNQPQRCPHCPGLH